jgi:hypothetical protein
VTPHERPSASLSQPSHSTPGPCPSNGSVLVSFLAHSDVIDVSRFVLVSFLAHSNFIDVSSLGIILVHFVIVSVSIIRDTLCFKIVIHSMSTFPWGASFSQKSRRRILQMLVPNNSRVFRAACHNFQNALQHVNRLRRVNISSKTMVEYSVHARHIHTRIDLLRGQLAPQVKEAMAQPLITMDT